MDRLSLLTVASYHMLEISSITERESINRSSLFLTKCEQSKRSNINKISLIIIMHR